MTLISTLRLLTKGKEGRTSIQKEQERGNRDNEQPQWEVTGDSSASSSQACNFPACPVLQVSPPVTPSVS